MLAVFHLDMNHRRTLNSYTKSDPQWGVGGQVGLQSWSDPSVAGNLSLSGWVNGEGKEIPS